MACKHCRTPMMTVMSLPTLLSTSGKARACLLCCQKWCCHCSLMTAHRSQNLRFALLVNTRLTKCTVNNVETHQAIKAETHAATNKSRPGSSRSLTMCSTVVGLQSASSMSAITRLPSILRRVAYQQSCAFNIHTYVPSNRLCCCHYPRPPCLAGARECWL